MERLGLNKETQIAWRVWKSGTEVNKGNKGGTKSVSSHGGMGYTERKGARVVT